MAQDSVRIYGYRWIILIAFMSVIIVNQLLWITFAPITINAAGYYGVSDLKIGMLSMSFMIVYIIVSIPASWIIDTYGFRIAVGIGAALTGIFGMTRGLLASNYNLVLLSQIGIAIGQPFILNAITKVAARWFPINERGTASGFGSLAVYLGIVVGMTLTPFLVLHSGIGNMLLVYGIVALAAGGLFLVLAREHPPTNASPPGMEERSLVFDSMKSSLRNKNFLLLLLIFFIGLGVFNSVTTWIEDILRPRGFSITQAGVTGGLMVFGGIAGAIIVPPLSDRRRKRVPYILIALAASAIGLIGITYSTSYALLLGASFILGFFLLAAAPIGFQYGAEITYPAPEGTSNGLLLLVGQISGILFIFGMDFLKSPGTGSMTLSLLILIGLMILSVYLSTRLRESSFLSVKKPGE